MAISLQTDWEGQCLPVSASRPLKCFVQLHMGNSIVRAASALLLLGFLRECRLPGQLSPAPHVEGQGLDLPQEVGALLCPQQP